MSRSIGNYITCGILAFVFILFLPVILLPLLLIYLIAQKFFVQSVERSGLVG